MKIDRRLIANFDWVVFGPIMILSLAGILTIYSATRPLPGGEQPSYYIKQTYWILIGLCALVAVVSFDYSWLQRLARFFFIAALVTLLLVPVLGKIGMGAQRWIYIGPLGFQPSEFFKLAFLMVLAHYFSQNPGNLKGGNVIWSFSVYVFPPLLLVIKQPDLGTGVLILCLFTLMAIAKGIQRKFLVFVVVVSLISVPFAGNIAWNELKDYQKNRILAFIKAEEDPEGVGYHITQSKVAVGSGGVLGKGYLEGTQGPFRFLPEKHTDFIFSVFAEEWGFLGSFFLLLCYLILILRGLHTAFLAKDEFGRLLAFGITFMFSLYTFINIGMTVGVMPVVGLPLPFMSYGGTSLVTNFLAAGILISIRARRFELFY